MGKNTTANSKVDLPVGFETDKAEDDLAREKLTTARIRLLFREPFFGNLATRLELVNADSWLPTAATDMKRFYYNSKFVNMLDPGHLEFLFGHEVLHCVYDHLGRTGKRDPRLANIAADFVVNADLVHHKIGKKIDVKVTRRRKQPDETNMG